MKRIKKVISIATAIVMMSIMITSCGSKSTDEMNTAPPQNHSTNSFDNSDWHQFLNDYEAWVDSYISFMKKYKDNPSDIKLISEYSKFLSETTEWAEKSKTYEDKLKEMSTEELNEYMSTIARILEKINSVVQ